jgi:hypothetical protein
MVDQISEAIIAHSMSGSTLEFPPDFGENIWKEKHPHVILPLSPRS